MQYKSQGGRKPDGGREEVRTCFGDGFLNDVRGYGDSTRGADLRQTRTWNQFNVGNKVKEKSGRTSRFLLWAAEWMVMLFPGLAIQATLHK